MLTGMLLAKGYKVRPVLSGRLALKTAQANPPDLILLDITMPEMNGYQVCSELKSNPLLRDIPVIFISALAETGDKVKAFEAGGVDYITKPFKIQEVQARVDTHLRLHLFHLELERTNARLHDMVRDQVREISESQMATIFSLAKLAESRDDETSKHLERVRHNCRLIASWLRENSPYRSQISIQFVTDIFWTSPLHDIGKVGVPDAILLKPGKLSAEEFEVVKKHTIIGAETLEAVRSLYPRNSFVSMGVDIAKQHHEKWDGSGYPQGLSGDSISLSARIMAVADVYDALRTKRVYKPAFTQEKTCRIIIEGSGSHFDPVIIDAFKNLHEKFDELRAGFLDMMHDNID
jgi:putative two-component system response regulator